MTVLASAQGALFDPLSVTVTPSMALAYAAAIGCASERYLDDAREGGLIAPPPICVSLEWLIAGDPSATSMLGLTPQERLRAVHASQATQFHRPLMAGETVSVSGRIEAIHATRAGALVTSRFDISGSQANDRITTSLCNAIYRGVETDAPPLSDDDTVAASVPPISEYAEPTTIPIARLFPHLYSECASIWNPIHTERRIALAAGLPDIIVHGTAMWALVWKQLSETQRDLSSLSGQFKAMAIPGEPVTLHTTGIDADTNTLGFRLENGRGDPAISDGLATFAME